MGCKSSKKTTATTISPTKTIERKKIDNNDRYCRCGPEVVSQSFVCPACRKVRLNVKKDVRNAQRKQRKEAQGARPAAAVAPRNLRRRAPSDDPSLTSSSPPPSPKSSTEKRKKRPREGTTNPQQANNLDNNSNNNITTTTTTTTTTDPHNRQHAIKRQTSLTRRSEQFWAVSHKVQQMVDLEKFYEMALRKLFRDFDIDQNGFIDAPELCQLIANATGNAGIYQPLTMKEAELFLMTSIKMKRRKDVMNVSEILLEESKFIKTMMKYSSSSSYHVADSFAERSGGDLTGGSPSSVSAHQRMTKKINQFVMLAKRRLERRSVSLFQLFHQYCGTHYVSSRNEWVKDVMDLNDLHAMMCDVANGRRDEEPTRIDVKQFIESMDANGDNHLQVKEFLTYMMRGLVQSRASMLRFSERSSMHHAVCCFLMNVDARHAQDDDHISLDGDQMEDLLHEVRGILTSSDLLGVARSMSSGKRGSSSTRTRSEQRGSGGGGGGGGGDDGDAAASSSKFRQKYVGGNDGSSSPHDSLNSSMGDSFNSQSSYDTKKIREELLRTEQREAQMMAGDERKTVTSVLERKMKRTQHSFNEDRRRNNDETNLIRSKHKENTRLRLQERERTRVLQRFNPEAIRQVAEQTTDELTKSRLLAIIGEQMRENGQGHSPQHQHALDELNNASNGLGSRRVRLSGSKRNIQRIRNDATEVEERFAQESEMLYEQQHANMEARLRRRREARERSGSVDDEEMEKRDDTMMRMIPRQIPPPLKPTRDDPFAGLNEAIAEEQRMGRLQPVLAELDTGGQSSESESTSGGGEEEEEEE